LKPQAEYYRNKLYPFQDKILKIITGCKNNFYLTGGTALSRFYLNHRYSDDLDFFENNEENFLEHSAIIIKELQKGQISVEILRKSNNFQRMICRDKELGIKMDFVNDVPYRTGIPERFPVFPRIDNWKNILSNKITAIGRLEPKDVADILFICRKYKFYWEDIFNEASKKAEYIDALDTSVIFTEFPIEYLKKINWVEEIDINTAYRDIQRISKDILTKSENGLSHNT